MKTTLIVPAVLAHGTHEYKYNDYVSEFSKQTYYRLSERNKDGVITLMEEKVVHRNPRLVKIEIFQEEQHGIIRIQSTHEVVKVFISNALGQSEEFEQSSFKSSLRGICLFKIFAGNEWVYVRKNIH